MRTVIFQPLLPCISMAPSAYVSPQYTELINSVPSHVTPFEVLRQGISKTTTPEQIARWGKECLAKKCHSPISAGYTGYKFLEGDKWLPAIISMTILRNEGEISGWSFLAQNGMLATYVKPSLRRNGWGEKLYHALPIPLDFKKEIFACSNAPQGKAYWKKMNVRNRKDSPYFELMAM